MQVKQQVVEAKALVLEFAVGEESKYMV